MQLVFIRQRLHFVRRTAEREFWRRRAEFLESHDRKDYAPFLRALEQEHARDMAALEGFLDAVLSANEPTVLPAKHILKPAPAAPGPPPRTAPPPPPPPPPHHQPALPHPPTPHPRHARRAHL